MTVVRDPEMFDHLTVEQVSAFEAAIRDVFNLKKANACDKNSKRVVTMSTVFKIVRNQKVGYKVDYSNFFFDKEDYEGCPSVWDLRVIYNALVAEMVDHEITHKSGKRVEKAFRLLMRKINKKIQKAK